MAPDICEDIQQYASVGGRRPPWEETVNQYASAAEIVNHGQEVWDFGWIPEAARDEETQQAYQEATDSFVPFQLEGSMNEQAQEAKVDLTDLWKHQVATSAIGMEFPGIWQLTGSCVGAGGGNILFTLQCVEVIQLRDNEEVKIPLWLLPYGRGRFYCGSRGRGEGSLESCEAKAHQEDGFLGANDDPAFPKYKVLDGGIQYTSAIEYEWSAGDRAPCTTYLDRSRKHLIKTVGIPKDAGEVRTAIRNGYPCGQGSMYGMNVTLDDEGTPLGKRGPRWSHKMTILGQWDHPKHGPLYKMVNQWGKAHRGFIWAWIPEVDVDWICKTGEMRCYSAMDGFPAQTLNMFI